MEGRDGGKGQVRWLDRGEVMGQRQFIHNLFGIAA